MTGIFNEVCVERKEKEMEQGNHDGSVGGSEYISERIQFVITLEASGANRIYGVVL